MASPGPQDEPDLAGRPVLDSSPAPESLVDRASQVPTKGGSSTSEHRASSVGRRRHSLPLDFLLPSSSSLNTSASIAESDHEASGETTNDGSIAAHRAAALRQISRLSHLGHRQSRSVGTKKSSSSQPVIVRTYSKGGRPESRRRFSPIHEERIVYPAEMPPVDAFGFDGIMKVIGPEISGTLDAIAVICSNSRYSLSNQYEVHMPPHERHDTSSGQTESNTTAEVALPFRAEETASRRSRLSSLRQPQPESIDRRSASRGRLDHISIAVSTTPDGGYRASRSHSRISNLVDVPSTSESKAAGQNLSGTATAADGYPTAESLPTSKATPPEPLQARRHSVGAIKALFSGFDSIPSQGKSPHSAELSSPIQSPPTVSNSPEAMTDTHLAVSPSKTQSIGNAISSPPGDRKSHQGTSLPSTGSGPKNSMIGNLATWFRWTPLSGKSPSTQPPAANQNLQIQESAEDSLRGLLAHRKKGFH